MALSSINSVTLEAGNTSITMSEKEFKKAAKKAAAKDDQLDIEGKDFNESDHIQKIRYSNIEGDQLRSYIERVERLEEEKATASADISDVYKEAKGNGFDVKTMRQIIKLRKVERHERDESITLLELYWRALGEMPLFEGLE